MPRVLDIVYRYHRSYQDAQPEAARLRPQVRTAAAQLQASGRSCGLGSARDAQQ
jgi:hypothetical protein